MGKYTIDQAIQRARELANGAPKSIAPPPQSFAVPPKSSAGLCDMCGKHAHVRIISKDGRYGICYACKKLLTDAYGDNWGKHAVPACEQAIKARGIKAEKLLAKREERRRKKGA